MAVARWLIDESTSIGLALLVLALVAVLLGLRAMILVYNAHRAAIGRFDDARHLVDVLGRTRWSTAT